MWRNAGGWTRIQLLKLGAALAMLCALAFALGQGTASLHAAIVATPAATQANHTSHPLNAPLINEQLTGAIGTPTTITNLANVVAAPSGQAVFSGSAQQMKTTALSAQPHADHAPPKQQRRQHDHTAHNKAAGDASHGGLGHSELSAQPAQPAHAQQHGQHGQHGQHDKHGG